MPKPRVFVTRQIPEQARALLAERCDATFWPEEAPPSYETLREHARCADGLYTTINDRVDAALLAEAPGLRVVSQLSVGLDNVDVAAATARGVPVGHTRGVLHKTTADLAFALLMAAARRVVEADRWVHAGQWRIPYHPLYFLGRDIHEKTMGIIGMGQTGVEMVKRARGFDMRVLYANRSRKPQVEERYGARYVDLETLLRESDFVSVHVALAPETRGLIAAPQLRLMKPTAVFVNAARGPIVDQRDLARALREGWIFAAGIDVSAPEPIAPDDPLLSLPNCVILPHIGSAAEPTRTRTALLAAENLLLGLEGRPLRCCANPEAYANSRFRQAG